MDKISPAQSPEGGDLTKGGLSQRRGVRSKSLKSSSSKSPKLTKIRVAVPILADIMREPRFVGTGSGQSPNKADLQKLLDVLAANWPNITLSCQTLRIGRDIHYYHLEHTPAYAEAISQIKESYADLLEQNMLNLGLQGTSFTFNDRIAYLRAHRPALYNPARRVVIESGKLDEGTAQKRLDLARGAVDAEIVKATSDPKERKQIMRGEVDIEREGSRPGEGRGE